MVKTRGRTMRRIPAGATKKVKVTTTKSVRPAKLKDTTKAAMMNVVNRILNRKSETKYRTSYTDDAQHIWTTFNSQIVGAGQFGATLPSLVQGTTDYDRLGDSIVPTKMYSDLRFRIKPVDPLTTNGNPVDVSVVIYYGVCKKYKNLFDVSTNSSSLSTTLLRLGNTSAVTNIDTKPFMGYAEDTHYVVNDVVWSLKRKIVRLYKAPGSLNGPASPGVLSTPNRAEAHVRLDFTSMLPAKLKYEDSSDNLPSNFAPVYAIGYYYNDGTPPDTGAGILEGILLNHLWFKDM